MCMQELPRRRAELAIVSVTRSTSYGLASHGRRPVVAGLQRLAGVDVGQPAVAVRRLAVDDVEERLLERFGDRAAPAAADAILSTDRIGVISTAVPTKNASSAM